MWTLLTIAAALAVDGEHRTPLCQQVVEAMEDDASKGEIKHLIAGAPAVEAADSSCLNRKRFPSFIGRKAQAELVKRGGLDALPTGPVRVRALLPDPCAIAAAQSGWKAAAGLACQVDPFGMLSDRISASVLATIRDQATAALASEQVEGAVDLQRVRMGPTEGMDWSTGAATTRKVPPGEYYVLEITIPDAVAAARASQGDLLVGLGARLGVDVLALVREKVREKVWASLAAHNVACVVIR